MMNSRTAASALAYLRAWWRELLCAGLLTLIGFAGQKDDALFAMFVGVTLAIGWTLGYSRKLRPLHRKIDNLTDVAAEMVDQILADREEPAEDTGPRLYLATRNGDRA